MNFIQRFNGFNLGDLFPKRFQMILVGLMVFTALSNQTLRAGSKPPEVTLRFHLQASPTMPKEQVVPVNLIDPPQAIAVRRLPELNEKHLEAIERLNDGRILVSLTTIGANLLDGATSSNMGFIMVVICNGRVVYAPVIDVPLRTGKIILPGGISDQEIMLFKQLIARKKRT